MSCGDKALIASQNRCAKAMRRALGFGTGAPDVGDCIGDMTGVSGGVARPTD